MHWMIFDIETNGLLPGHHGKTVMDSIHCIVCRDQDNAVTIYHDGDAFADDVKPAGTVNQGIKFLKSYKGLLAGHNIQGFDIPAIDLAAGVKLDPSHVWDTLVVARLFWPDIKPVDFKLSAKGVKFPPFLRGSHSLAAWGLRLRQPKDDYKGGWETFNEAMLRYCIQDTNTNRELFLRQLQWAKKHNVMDDDCVLKYCVTLEHEFAARIDQMMDHGFLADQWAMIALASTLGQRKNELVVELEDLFPPRVVPEKVRVMPFDISNRTHVSRHFDRKGIPYAGKQVSLKELRQFGSGAVSVPSRERALAAVALDAHEAKKRGDQMQLALLIDRWGNKIPPFRKVTTPEREIPFNPASRQQIADNLTKKYGWAPKVFTNSGQPKIDETILSALPYPEAKELVEFFTVNKRLGQVAEGREAWLRKIKKDGRIHGYVNHCGAVTSRCTHSGPNVGQVPAVRAPYGKECRSCWTVPEGYVLIGADASGLELRCLAHYMARYDGGEYGRKLLEEDIHTVNMHAAGLTDRDQAKTFIYAFLYGAGDGKLGSIVGGGVKSGSRLRKRFMAGLPALAKLVDAVKEKAKSVGYLYGLDGRPIQVRHEHAALNTLLQGAGSVAMKLATVLMHERLENFGLVRGEDFAMVAHVHDEYQIEAREERQDVVAREAVAAFGEAGKILDFRCPLDGEAHIGRSWAETH